MLGITVSGAPDVLNSGTSVNTVMALGAGLAVACAALTIRTWGRDGRSATVGALIYGLAPFLTSVVVGYLDITLAIIPPLVFLLLNEVLIKRRRHALLIGVVAGIIAASTTFHTTPPIISACLSFGIGAVVIAMFRPAAEAMPLATIAQALAGAVIGYLGATAYPVVVNRTGPRGISVSVLDNGNYLRRLVDSIIPGTQNHLGGGGLGTYLAGGLLAVAAVEWFRRATFRWSVVPVAAAAVIILMNVFPRFSVHL